VHADITLSHVPHRPTYLFDSPTGWEGHLPPIATGAGDYRNRDDTSQPPARHACRFIRSGKRTPNGIFVQQDI
jgi:hypothetical protein